ncbi:MAG: hypothetical protein GX868_00745 [Actinobacteria bacterium]|nr:hypothetical protein [Actinomycetota bacterium]
MKRLLTTTAAALTFSLAVTGCGIASDDSAASVDGTDISFETVADLASAEEIVAATQGGLVSAGEGTTGSGTRRTALTQLVQIVAAEQWIENHGGFTDADRAAGKSGRQESNSESFGDLTERYFTTAAALERIATEATDGSEDEARASLYSLLGPALGDTFCLEAVQVDVADAGAFDKLVGENGSVPEVEEGGLSFIPFTDGEQCYTSLSLTGYLDPIRNAPIGTWYHETVTLQGETFALFVKKGSQNAGGLDDPATVELLDAVAAQPTQVVSLFQYAAMAEADITVDPRLGRWDAIVSAITPPLVPRLPVTANAAADDVDLESLLGSMQ